MRGIAYKQHPPAAQLVQAFAAVGVGAHPDNFIFAGVHSAAQLPIDPFAHHVFTADFLGVGIGPHLVVDAPHAIGHQVLPHGAAFVKGRFNPGVALNCGRVFKTHVGDAPSVITFFGSNGCCYPSPKRTACAAAVDNVGCFKRVATRRGLELQRGVVFVLLKRGDAV